MDRRPYLAAALALGTTIGLGIFLAGLMVAHGLVEMRASERRVVVKGFAEREVEADVALWPVVFTVTANDLGTLQRELEEKSRIVTAFLTEQGFAAADWSRSAPRVTDFRAQGFGGNLPPERYQAEGTVTVRSTQTKAVQEALARSDELVKRGVAVIRSYEFNTQYLFTKLNEIKPEMIAEATQDARHAAEQFARDSGAEVGSIRSAQQGLFSIEDRDAFSPEIKRVRVVTTVEYFLEE